MNDSQQSTHHTDLLDAWHHLTTSRDETCRRLLTLESVLHPILEAASPSDAANARDQLQHVRRGLTDQTVWDELDRACTAIIGDEQPQNLT